MSFDSFSEKGGGLTSSEKSRIIEPWPGASDPKSGGVGCSDEEGHTWWLSEEDFERHKSFLAAYLRHSPGVPFDLSQFSEAEREQIRLVGGVMERTLRNVLATIPFNKEVSNFEEELLTAASIEDAVAVIRTYPGTVGDVEYMVNKLKAGEFDALPYIPEHVRSHLRGLPQDGT